MLMSGSRKFYSSSEKKIGRKIRPKKMMSKIEVILRYQVLKMATNYWHLDCNNYWKVCCICHMVRQNEMRTRLRRKRKRKKTLIICIIISSTLRRTSLVMTFSELNRKNLMSYWLNSNTQMTGSLSHWTFAGTNCCSHRTTSMAMVYPTMTKM